VYYSIHELTLWENGSLSHVIRNHIKVVVFGSQKLLPVADVLAVQAVASLMTASR